MKRSTSAPLIPELLQQHRETGKPHPPPSPSSCIVSSGNAVGGASSLLSRRGMSTSNVSLPSEVIHKMMVDGSPRKQPPASPMASPLPLSRMNSPTSRQHRVEQLKKEEDIDERKNEKEVQDQIILTKNCDEFLKIGIDADEHDLRHEQDFRYEQMEVWPSQPSPSHQPLSPLASRMMRSRSLTPTSPSSTRPFTYRRSCSPVLRPSSLCIQIGHKRPRDHDTQEDMDTSPSAPCKRLQLSYPSPLNLSPSISPLMNNSPLHQSFSTCSRKSSSTQSESTPLSSPSSYLHSTNPFAVNYDSGNCEHWQSNSGSNSNCSSACHSPLVMHGKGGEPMAVSVFNSKLSNQHAGPGQDDPSLHGGAPVVSNATNQFRYLSPSPGIVINEEGKVPADSIEIMTEAPTPLSPKGLQFRQKLFPQNLPSPIPRPLPYSTSSSLTSTPSPVPSAPSYATYSLPSSLGSQRGALMAAPASPKSHQQHSSSLHHDKHLSPFKSDHFQGRILRTAVAKNRLNSHLRQQKVDPLRSSTSSSVMMGVSGGGVSGGIDHLTNRFTSHASSSGRLVTSSPLANSMSSSLEEGGVATVGTGFRSLPSIYRRRASDASVESGSGGGGREESLMESSDCESVDSIDPPTTVVGSIGPPAATSGARSMVDPPGVVGERSIADTPLTLEVGSGTTASRLEQENKQTELSHMSS